MTTADAPLRTLNGALYPCACVQTHVPTVRYTHEHHIWPLSWGGPDHTTNIVVLCPAGHDTVHWLHRAWEKRGAPYWLPVNRHLHDIALRGWQAREAIR